MSLDLLPQPRHAEITPRRVPYREPATTLDASLPSEGYRLRLDHDAVVIDAADTAGEFYARATLAQLRRTHDGSLPVGAIVDWPDLAVRGVMVDIARDKVPTMETLFALIDRLASWKVNQLQLYTEHTFAFRDHREVWADASPLTAEEVQTLDQYCRARFIELVPNQNCLGHMSRWLRHPRYAPLALAPDGYLEHGQRRPPSTIDPANPASLALVRELLAELLPNYTSRRVHVGLDEPWELPEARIDDYLAWLRALRALPELDGREMLVWGDILGGRAEVIDALPDGVTVCEWGYDDHFPFDARAAVLEQQAQPYLTCPGTSSWLTILGRVANIRGNSAAAAGAAITHGGGGVLNADWGDLGHLQYLPISDPGFAYGAAVSWCLDTNRDLDLARALSTHCYDDPTGELGAALVALGDVYRVANVQLDNLSSIVLSLYYPQLDFGRGPLQQFRPTEFDAVLAVLAAAEQQIARAAPRRADGALVKAELRNALALVRVLAHDALARLAGNGSLASVGDEQRAALASELDPVVANHRILWHARNRPGGYPDSERWLTQLRDRYVTGPTDPRRPDQ